MRGVYIPEDIKQQHEAEKRMVAKLKQGMKVFYHSVVGDRHDGVVRQIEGAPWKLGHGTYVVNVTGISGGVWVLALTVAPQ